MMPNLDPRTMKAMMSKMGIRSTDINAEKVVIYCADMQIVIEEPQVTKIEMQGTTSFQIAGNISEKENPVELEISEDDIKLVMEKTGINDKAAAEKAIRDANGDIASAIISLEEGKGD